MTLYKTTEEFACCTFIPKAQHPIQKDAANSVRNYLQCHTKQGPYIIPPSVQSANPEYEDNEKWCFYNYHLRWGFNKRIDLFDSTGWL